MKISRTPHMFRFLNSKKLRITSLMLVLFAVSKMSFAQFDYEFWMPPIWQTGDSQQNAPSELFITTPFPTPVDVHVQTPDGTTFVFDGTVTSGTPLSIPLSTTLGQTNLYNTVMSNNGLIVTASRPIQCVHKVSAFYNQTLVTLKGNNGRGTEFWCGSQTINNASSYGPNERHFITVMAMEDNTQITFQTPFAMDLAGAGDLPNPYTITLQRNQCYLIRSNATNQHVAGARVTSNKEIVVISGSTHTRMGGAGADAADGGTDQLVPLQLAGTSFAVLKGNNNNPYDYAIVVATQANTRVFIDGSATPAATLNAGQFYNYTLTGTFGTPHSIRTDKVAYVYHVSGTSQDDEVDMSIMPQLECTGSRYIEFSKFTINTSQQIMPILASPESVATLRLNGVLYSSVPGAIVSDIPGLPNWKGITFPTSSLANNNIVRSDGFFHAGWLTGNAGTTGAYGYLSGFDDAFEFVDPTSNLPTNIYNLGPLCQGQSIDHCIKVYSCGRDHEITNVANANGPVVVAPPSSPADSCFRYTAPTNFVGYDTVTFTVRNNFGFEGQLDIVFLITNPNTPIDAGSNQQICTVSTATLSAVNPDPYAVGYWTVAQGGATLTSPNSPTTGVTNLANGPNTFIWHQSYPGCGVENVDLVQIFRYSGTPPTANAGPDVNLCSNSATYVMQANSPGVTATGTWEILSGNATLLNINSASATVSNIGIGVNTFRWTISNGPCPGGETNDIMVINVFNSNHPASNAGPDQSVCRIGSTSASATLTALTLPQSPATATWTLISGTGTITSPNSASTTVTGLGVGVNTFRWTISNGPCGTLTDDVQITVFSSTSPAANAGPDQTVCVGNSATLAANTPTSPAVGTWTVVSGSGSFVNPNSPNTVVNGLAIGTNTLRWTANNGPCPGAVTTDDVVITVYPSSQPAANAGADQTLCFAGSAITANLTANSATSPGVGLWTVVSGSGTFSNASSPSTTVTGMSVGTNTYRWTITNGGCTPAQSDDVVITVFNNTHPAANAGADASLCTPTNTYTMTATPAVAPATGIWTLVSGTGTITSPTSATTGITNLGVGVNIFQWTILNGACGNTNSDQMTITVFSNAAPAANAGPDQEFCFNPASLTSATMAANAATAPATGLWTLVSGSGTIISPTSPTTLINNLGVGTNVFRWTINNGTCGSTNDLVAIRVFSPNQTAANAGADQTICSTTATISLSANSLIAPATGQWTVVSGTGNFTSPTSPSTTVTGMSVGQNVYQWTIYNGPCVNPVALTDQVVVNVFSSAQTAANAGPDQSICSTTSSVNLTGTTPIFPATGTWSVINGSGTFSDANSPITTVSGLSVGLNTFRYTISNGPCGSPTTDDVVITVFDVNAPFANAGADQAFCLPTTSATLGGNTPTFPATGVWTLVSGTGTITNPTSPTSGVTGLTVGENIFRWTINNGTCGTITNDLVSIFLFNSSQELPNAGPDASMCTPQSTYTMQANAVTFPAVGTWTLVSGTGTISNVNSPTANISGLGVGANVFRWTITNGPCPNGFNTDDMTIFVFDENQLTANAGPDQSLCRDGSNPIGTTMAGSSVVFPGGGTWTIIQGTGAILNANSPTTTVSNLGIGENIFRWTVTNGPCNPGITFDQVSIFVYPSTQPAANAGADQQLCSTNASTTLAANTPVFPGSGVWTVVQGTATFANASSPNTTVSGLGLGTNILQWTINNGPCVPNSTSDQVSIVVYNNAQLPANAGSDFSICSTQASITLTGNTVTAPATGAWTLISGTGVIATPNASTTTVTGLSVGTNTFRYTINNGPCSAPTTDDIVVTVFSAAQQNANAGVDQSICLPTNSVTVSGTALIGPATAQWTLVSGVGTITNPNAVSTTITGLGAGVNIFQYTISNGPCSPSSTTDQVVINVFTNTQPAANAGADQSFCEPVSSATLTGNNAIVPATGVWTLVSGTGTIVNANSAVTQVTGLSVGQNIFRWTINNGPCAPASTFDEVSIFIFDDSQLAADAGPDQSLCSPNFTTSLSGNPIIFPATGTWTLVSGTGTFANANSPTTSVSGLSIGENIFQWNITNGPCANSSTSDQVSIFVFDSNAAVADAGVDQSICTPTNSVIMAANSAVFPGFGTWTLVSGSGTIVTPNSPTSAITNLAVGENIFRWTINNGSCGSGVTDDLVSIFVYSAASPSANAGDDQDLCTPITSATMSGSVPIFPSYGVWSLVSGTGTIVSPNSPTTSITGLTIGPNVFRWTVFNGPCGNAVTTDDVTITLYNGGASAPYAGIDQELCSPTTSTTLAADPAAFPGVGTWSVVSGTGTFAGVNNPNTVVNGLSIGVNVFRWTVNYATCGNQFDEVSIIVYNSAQGASNAGADQELCNNQSTTNLTASAVLAPGYGTWSVVSGSAAIADINNPTSSVSNLPVGENRLVWTVYNGNCLAPALTTDTVSIWVFDGAQQVADAGEDQSYCTPTSTATVNGNALIYPASGVWTIVQGSAVIANPTSPTTAVSGLAVGETILRWTIDNGPCANSITSDEISIFIYDITEPLANAGLDQSFCTPTSTTVLSGSTIIFPGSGLWTVLSGTAVVTDPTSAVSGVTNLTVGEHQLQWTVDNGPCGAQTTDVMSIFIYDENNPDANAGADQELCLPTTSTQLAASVYTFPATGTWTVISGSVTFTNPNDPNTTITNIGVGENILQWTVDNGPCANGVTTDQVSIRLYNDLAAEADANVDQRFCEPQSSTTMNATVPDAPGYGTWSVVSGSAVIADINDPNTAISGLVLGEAVLRWTVYNGPCSNSNSFDEVSIFIFDDNQLVANAGGDQDICTPQVSTTLSGNTYVFPATGTWTLVSGSGTILNPNDPNTTVTDLAIGANVFRWTIDNGPCPNGLTTDDVVINLFDSDQVPAAAGDDQEMCLPQNSTTMSGSAIVGSSVGTWSIIAGSATIANNADPNTAITDLVQGENIFVWSVDNGSCGVTTDTVSIFVFIADPALSDAGDDVEFCTPTSTYTMDANTPDIPGVGTWSIAQGTATFNDVNDPNTDVSGLTIGENILVWSIYNGPCEPVSIDSVSIFIYDENMSPADAGEDQEICLPLNSVTMTANVPVFPATGVWTLVQGGGTITDPTSATTSITDLPQGINIFRWSTSNGPCANAETFDEVEIRVFPEISQNALAGADQGWCLPVTSSIMLATPVASPAFGTWTLVGGTGTIAQANNPNSAVTDLSVGANSFLWTIYNGPCYPEDETDVVTIFIYDNTQTTADAGPDQSMCTPNIDTQLAANAVTYPATGIWTLVEGSAVIENETDPATVVTDLAPGVNVFVWTVDNGECDNAITTDTMTISIYLNDLELANAGEDQELCFPTTTAALTGSALGGAAVGTWSVVSGGGTFVDAHASLTDVINLPIGINTFVWTVDNGPCAFSTDTVSISVFDPTPNPADAGVDGYYCTPTSTHQMAANAAIYPAVGTWTRITGSGIISDVNDPNALITGLTVGENIYIWTIDNGPCNEPTVDVMSIFIYNENTPNANAGIDQELCLLPGETTISATMAASGAEFPAIGTWSVIQGNGVIGDLNSPVSEMSNLSVGTNIFVWTVDNGPCPNGITSDTVEVRVFDPGLPAPNAGPDQAICTPINTVVMSGSVVADPNYGFWTLIQGSANIVDPNNPSTTITELAIGINAFTWTVYNGNCDNSLSSDTVYINVFDINQPPANAGEDQELCLPVTATTLNGNALTSPATGLWTVASGTAVFDDPTNPTTGVSGLSVGNNLLVWTINNGPCEGAITSDTVNIQLFDPEAVSVSAGDDIELCVPVSCTLLSASQPSSPQIGTWTILSAVNGNGPIPFGSFNNVNDPNAQICGLGVGVHTLQWEIYNGPCDNDSHDEVTVSVFDISAPAADAGADQELCGDGSSTSMSGNAAVFPGVGTWSVLSSPGQPVIANANDPLTSVSGLDIGVTQLIWTIYNGPCNTPTSDTVTVTVYNPDSPNATAGEDQYFCENLPETVMNGSSVLPPAFGTWTILGGGGTFASVNDPLTAVTDIPLNENVYIWTVYNGACPNGTTSDTVSVYVNDLTVASANAGPDLFFCGSPDSLLLSGSVTVGLATSQWTIISGSGTIDNPTNNNPYMFDVPLGITSLVYTVDNGECGISSDVTEITVYDPNLAAADAGPDGAICAAEFGQFNLMGNAVNEPAMGYWDVTDGPGELLDTLDAETAVTSLGQIITELVDVPSTFVWTIDNGVCGSTSDTVVYILKDCLTLIVPDAFSPNGDGVNDNWVIPNISSYPNNQLKIFNRWGAEVYSASPYKNEWTGISIHPATIGNELPVSTYYYILDLGTGEEALHGYVYLKR